MWNKAREGSHPQQAVPERQAVHSSVPIQAVSAGPSRKAAVIGASMQIIGDIQSLEELYIDGQVDGSLQLDHALTIGPNGKVKANIKAKDVLILGSVRGDVEVTDKIAIRDKGSLVGDIKTSGIIIDDGAYFKGSIDIIRPTPPRVPVPDV